MALETVSMGVKTDTGDLLVIRNVLQIVKNRVVLELQDIVSVVNLFIQELHAHRGVLCIVSKEFVTKLKAVVLKDARQDSMETRVITHAVPGVQEGHVTNIVETAMLDVNRTGQDFNATVRITITKTKKIRKLQNKYATLCDITLKSTTRWFRIQI